MAADSNHIYKGYLELVGIFCPSTGTAFRDHFTNTFVVNLEHYINDFPDSPYIEEAYEMLVWWLYTAQRYDELREICRNFLSDHPGSGMRSYVLFHLGNASFFAGEWSKAREAYISVEKDALPKSVYPGWGRQYIIDEITQKMQELELYE
jgi:outer membrane protein assembly factor BamD (BamD/ComL family)